MIEYTCPKCGEKVMCIIYLTYPTQTNYRCTKCGYNKTVTGEKHTLVAPE